MAFDLQAVAAKYQLKEEEQQILRDLTIDESQREQISQYDQRTEAWLRARDFRLTASRFGAARGHCQYTTHKKLLQDMLWSEFKGNAATEWGVKHEDGAVDAYRRFMLQYKNLQDSQFVVTHCGLLVSVEYPWIGVSVDAFVFDDSEAEPRKRGGGEIKCPYGKKLYPFIPSQYYDQIQGSMGFLKLPWWDFVVWTPTQTQVRRYDFDATYFATELLPRLEQFYMTEYLPRLVLKRKGLLKQGKIDPVMEITMELSADGCGARDDAEPAFNFATGDVPVVQEKESRSHLSAAPIAGNQSRFDLSTLLQ